MPIRIRLRVPESTSYILEVAFFVNILAGPHTALCGDYNLRNTLRLSENGTVRLVRNMTV